MGLQLPESEAKGALNGRLVDKFPSTTTLWHVLRKFESGVAGNTSTRNLTGRAVSNNNNVDSGASSGSSGLVYETPVVLVMGRELSSFTDLQKSMAKLGYNSGSVLVRLSFRRTEEPLEEAMLRIEGYFKSVDNDTPKTVESQGSSAVTGTVVQQEQGQGQDQEEQQPKKHKTTPETTEEVQEAPVAPVESTQPPVQHPAPESSATPAHASEAAPTFSSLPPASSRPVTVFSPPTGNTPVAAQTAYNENDYVPTTDQALAHQKRLNQFSRPNRLLSDAEIAAKSKAEEERLSTVQNVDVKVRFPDQSQVVATFGKQDTGKSLYDFVRTCLTDALAGESFAITYSPNTSRPGLGGRNIQSTIPESDKSLLIKDLGLAGRVLVNFSWVAGTSPATRGAETSLLKPELQSQAQNLKIEQPPELPDDTTESSTTPAGPSSSTSGERRPLKKGAVPKWLKLPGKK